MPGRIKLQNEAVSDTPLPIALPSQGWELFQAYEKESELLVFRRHFIFFLVWEGDTQLCIRIVVGWACVDFASLAAISPPVVTYFEWGIPFLTSVHVVSETDPHQTCKLDTYSNLSNPSCDWMGGGCPCELS